MKRFRVPEGNPESFVDTVRGALAGRSLGQIVDLCVEAGQIVVRLRKMGTTELRYDTQPEGEGFVATLAAEKVAPFHAPFRADFEHKLEKVLEDLGASFA